MNILMTENAVHEDIIAKLWQAYSTPEFQHVHSQSRTRLKK